MPAGGGLAAETITTGYDANGFVMSSSGVDAYLSSVSYYPWGSTYRTVSGQAGKQVRLTTNQDEATRRLTSGVVETQNQITPTTWDEKRTDAYTYDNAGEVKSIAEKLAGSVVSAQCFGYDNLTRLVDAYTNTTGTCTTPTTPTAGPDPYRTHWTYDAVGDRTQQTRFGLSGASDTVTNYTYPAAGAVRPHTLTTATTTGPGAATNSYTYDTDGNTSGRTLAGAAQTLTWDPEGHLATQVIAAQTTSYLYDADGNRLLRKDPDGSTTAYLGGYELKKNNSGTLACTRYYTAGGNTIASRNSAGLTWLANDNHGTAQVSINPTTLATTTRRSMPFGETRGTAVSWSNDKGFVGGTADPTGLTHLGAREYDNGTGRFLSGDPRQDSGDPQQWQNYAYADNSPVTKKDSEGLKPTCEKPNGMQGPCTGSETPDAATPTSQGGTVHPKPTGAGDRQLKDEARDGPINLCSTGYQQPTYQCGDFVQNDLRRMMSVTFLDFIIQESVLAGIDPRLLLAVLAVESGDCHCLQKWDILPWVDSIGIGNMHEDVFNETKAESNGAISGSWSDTRTDPFLSIRAVAFRLKELMYELPADANNHYSREELVRIAYQFEPKYAADARTGNHDLTGDAAVEVGNFRIAMSWSDKMLCHSEWYSC